MGRLSRRVLASRKTPYSRPKCQGRPSRSAHTIASAASVTSQLVNCEYSHDGEHLTFHLRNGMSYTILTADSSPENHWGTIYAAKCYHPESRRDCVRAIKASDFVLQKRRNNDPRANYRRPRQDFDREVQTFQFTKHQNVVQMYDFWEWEDRGYIAMKMMKGSLGDILFEPVYESILHVLRTDETVLAEMVRQVLTGLDHLHSQNIIYRDFKPDNLLISAHPRMKLADFGNVHFSPDKESKACGKEGTESYMSPEMRTGRYYNTKTDIWSFGITMLNVLFDGDSFPNFDNMGPSAARKYADEQTYTSVELKDFMQGLFLRSCDRPTAAQLLEHPFVLQAKKSAFKKLFHRFPYQDFAVPVISNRAEPDTPPPTPEQNSIMLIAPHSRPVPDHIPPRLTPPCTPSPSPSNKVTLKLVYKSAKEQTIRDCIKVTRRSQRLSQHGV